MDRFLPIARISFTLAISRRPPFGFFGPYALNVFVKRIIFQTQQELSCQISTFDCGQGKYLIANVIASGHVVFR